MSDMGTMQTHGRGHDPHPDLAAYALGVLDPEDQAALEGHLEGCAACRDELLRYEAVVGDLGMIVAPVPPRPGLRESLLDEIGGEDAPATPHAAPMLLQRRVPAIWLGIAATIAILSLAVVGYLYMQVRDMQDQRDSAMYAQRAVADYMKDGGTVAALMPADGAPESAAPGHGSLIVAPDQGGAMLVVYDLAPTGDDLTYRAFAERGGERVDLGELRVNDEGVGWLYLHGPEPMSTYETVGMMMYSPEHPDGTTFLVAPVE